MGSTEENNGCKKKLNNGPAKRKKKEKSVTCPSKRVEANAVGGKGGVENGGGRKRSVLGSDGVHHQLSTPRKRRQRL